MDSYRHQQDSHCTYNITLRRILVIIVTVEEQYPLHILSVAVFLR